MPGSNGGVRATRWAIGLAAGGVLLGHGITYTIVHPDVHARAGVLASTGHAYLHLLEGPGLMLAISSVLGAVLLGLGRLGTRLDRGTLFRSLATIQVAAFAAMEVGERVGSGAGFAPDDAFLFGLGLTVQLALAWLGARLLTALRQGGERIARTLAVVRGALPRPSFSLGVPPALVPALAPVAGPRPGRGPPLRRR
jgi:hypothetical protein